MNWILRTLVGAVLAGIGLKIGSEIFEGVKKGIKEHGECTDDEAEDGAGEEGERLPGDVVDLGDVTFRSDCAKTSSNSQSRSIRCPLRRNLM